MHTKSESENLAGNHTCDCDYLQLGFVKPAEVKGPAVLKLLCSKPLRPVIKMNFASGTSYSTVDG